MRQAGIRGVQARQEGDHHQVGSTPADRPTSSSATSPPRHPTAVGDGPDLRADVVGDRLRLLHRRRLPPHDRRLAGGRHMRTEMVLDALEMARWSRRAGRLDGLVAHSDAGSQFTSIRYGERLDEIGARPVASGASAIPTTTRWPRRSTASTRPNSSAGPTPTAVDDVRTLSSPRSRGSTGTTTSGCTATCGDIPPAEFEAASTLPNKPATGVGIQ